MNDRPLAILEPTLSRVAGGHCTALRRAADGMLGKLQPGDRLWIREPFFLDQSFDRYTPSAALALGAKPTFARDIGGKPKPSGLGQRQPAYKLKREWHRAHVVVDTVRLQRLQDITEAEAQAEGFASRDHWILAWEGGISFCKFRRRWADNPSVVLFGFHYVAAPLPAPLPAPSKRVKNKPGPKPGRARAEREARLSALHIPVTTTPESRAAYRAAVAESRRLQVPPGLPPAATDGKTWCDQCEKRVSPAEGRSCSSPFCKADPAELQAQRAA